MFLINASLLHLYRVLQDMNVIQTCQNVNFIITILIMLRVKESLYFLPCHYVLKINLW